MKSASRRQTRFGRWMPLGLYTVIVAGWFAEGVAAGVDNRLWLVVFALPAPVIHFWRTRRRKP